MKDTAFKAMVVVFASLILAGCAGGGSSRVSYGVGMGYGGYYGHGAWRGHPSYPVYIGGGGGPDIPYIPEGPSAVQMPEYGMPGAGMGMMDMGGFDDF